MKRLFFLEKNSCYMLVSKLFNFGREKDEAFEDFQDIKPEYNGTGFEPIANETKVECDCCREQKILKIEKDYSNNGESMLSAPIISYENGINVQGVNICDDCFSKCVTEKEKQALWIKGQVNKLSDEAQKLKDKRASLYAEIEAINSNLYHIDDAINKYEVELNTRESEEKVQE